MTATFDHTVNDLLSRTAERTPRFGAGPHAALAAASAAALATMGARFAGWDESRVSELVAAGTRLRDLADADGPAFDPLLQAWGLPDDTPDRSDRIAAAARIACAVPLGVCRVAARLAAVSAELIESGKRDLVGDATTALRLAEAAVASAADVVRLNAGPDRAPDLVEEARALAALAREHAARLREAE